MKRGWLALVLILIVLGLGIVETLYLNTNTDVLIDMLNEADAQMERGETAQARSIAERLDNRYSGEAKVYDIFLFHSEVTQVSSDLAALRRYAQAGDISEFLAASARIKRTLLSMRAERIPRWENIL